MNRYDIGGQTFCTAKAALAVGTTTTLTIGTTTPYCIRGKAYSKAAVSNTASPTTDAATGSAFSAVPVGYGCAFLLGVNAAGTVKAVQGTIVPLDVSGNFINASNFGGMPEDFCPMGYVTVKVGSTGAAWTFGVSNFSGPPTGVTFAFQDCMSIPDRPQIS